MCICPVHCPWLAFPQCQTTSESEDLWAKGNCGHLAHCLTSSSTLLIQVQKAVATTPRLFALLANLQGSPVAFSIVTFGLVKERPAPWANRWDQDKDQVVRTIWQNGMKMLHLSLGKRHWGPQSVKGSQGRWPVTWPLLVSASFSEVGWGALWAAANTRNPIIGKPSKLLATRGNTHCPTSPPLVLSLWGKVILYWPRRFHRLSSKYLHKIPAAPVSWWVSHGNPSCF